MLKNPTMFTIITGFLKVCRIVEKPCQKVYNQDFSLNKYSSLWKKTLVLCTTWITIMGAVVHQIMIGSDTGIGSVTLIQDGSINCLVDCGSPWDRELIITELSKVGVQPLDIRFKKYKKVFSEGFEFIMDADWGQLNPDGKPFYKPIDWKDNLQLTSNVEVMKTPGHTSHDLSVIVKTEKLGIVVIAGDIFECENDLENNEIWEPNSSNVEEQKKSRRILLQKADWIVPGHGKIFNVKKK